MDLYKIRDEINNIISQKQKELQLTFEEENHEYTMVNLDGQLKNDWPSVSKVMKFFYDEFPTEEAALKKAKGDVELAEQLKEEWAAAGTYSTNMGSRVHFLLEKKSHEIFKINKQVRKPDFNCDFEQILKGDSMIHAGTNFLNLMNQRGAVLLDTEIVLGCNQLGYVGQPDKVWIIQNKEKTDIGLIITDYKTNKPKNFEENQFTKRMYPPFQKHPNNALGHYFLQLPFYGKLLLKMLQGSKYENIKLYGCIIVHLKEDSEFEEYRVPKDVTEKILSMKMENYLTNKL
jgi:hypothetical protein